MKESPLRVVVFAAQQLLVDALAETLEAVPPMRVVGRTSSVNALLGMLGRVPADVLVLHALDTLETSLQLARSALEHDPDLGIVLVTEPSAADLTRQALEIGVRGWIRSDEPLQRLVLAVREVAVHEVFIPVSLLTSVLPTAERATSSPSVGHHAVELTPRQRDVLRCLMDGRSRTETGRLLNMSPNTVRTHIGAILQRLQVHTTLAAVAEARRSGLLIRSAEELSTANGVDALGRSSGVPVQGTS
jgi:DNA-binding NarL/FixJ family response regulator